MRRSHRLLVASIALACAATACGGPGWRGEPTTDEFLSADEYLEREAANDDAAASQPGSQPASQPASQPTTQPSSQPTP